MRRGTHVDRFRTVAVHIEADPVFARFDVSPGVAQLRQYGIQGIRLRVTAEDLAAGNRRGHQESPGFNTVRQHTVDAAAQALHAFDGNAIATLACDFCAQRVQEVGGIDNLRLASGVFNNRRSSASVAALMMVTVAPTLTLSITICAPFRRPLTEALT